MRYVELRVLSNANVVGAYLPDYVDLVFDATYGAELSVLEFSYPVESGTALGIAPGMYLTVYVDSTATEQAYVIEKKTADELTEEGVPVYRWLARSVKVLLEDDFVWPSAYPSAQPQGHSFIDSTVGTMMRTLIDRSKERGFLAHVIATSFTGAVDSSSTAWPAVMDRTYSTGTSILAVLSELFDQGQVEPRMRNLALELFRPGALPVHRPITSICFTAGLSLAESTVEQDATEFATDVLLEGDEGVTKTSTYPTGYSFLGRRRAKYVQSGGVSDPGTLQLLSDAYLQQFNHIMEERTVVVPHDTVNPFIDYQPGDWVWFDILGTKVELQIKQISVVVPEDGDISVGVTVGDLMADSMTRLQRRIDAITGSNSGTYGAVPTTSPGTLNLAPAAPTIPSVTAGVYLDGPTNRVAVTVTWTAVTTNSDGSTANDIAAYEVFVRPLPSSGDWQFIGRTDTTALFFSPLPTGEDRTFKVECIDTYGVRSAPSPYRTVTLPTDGTGPERPSATTNTVKLGVATITWDGKDYGGALMPYDFDYAALHVSTISGFTPSSATYVDRFYGAGSYIYSGAAYNTPYYVKLIAYDTSGNASPASTQSTFTATPLVSSDLSVGVAGNKITVGTSPPSSPSVGDQWIDSGNGNVIKIWDGAAWTIRQDAAIATANSTASSALSTANLAVTTANGKNTVTYSASSPTTANANIVGDAWFRYSGNNLIEQWRGNGGTAGNYQWVQVSIGDNLIASGISAGKITTGTLDAARIAANSLSIGQVSGLQTALNTKTTTFAQTSTPTALNIGDLWVDTDDNNKLYRANATGTGGWVAVTPAVTKTFVQSSIPTSVVAGDMWVDTDDNNKTYVAKSAGADAITTGEWELFSSVVGTTTFAQTSIPTSTTIGDLWIDTDDNNKLYRAAAAGATTIATGQWEAYQSAANKTYYQTTAPASGYEGDLWFDSDDNNRQYRWGGLFGTTARTNLATNPSLETATTGWSGNAVTFTRSTDWAASGTYSAKIVPSGASTDSFLYIPAPPGGWTTAGVTFTVSATIYIPVALTGSLQTGRDRRIWIVSTGGTNFQAISDPFTGTGSQRLKVTFTVPSGVTSVSARLYNGFTNSATNAVYWDALTIEQGTTDGSYFDGAQPNCAWTGTAHLSTSTYTPGWTEVTAKAPTTFVQNDPPTALAVGDMWVDSNDSNKTYVARSVGADQVTAGEWELMVNGPKTFVQTSVPTSLNIGDVWVDSDDSNKTYVARAVGATTIANGQWELVQAETVNLVSGWKYTGQTTINGGMIQTDTITAGAIQAGAISTSKLAVGALLNNILPNPYMEEADNLIPTRPASWTTQWWNGNGSSFSFETASPIQGTRSLKLTNTAVTDSSDVWVPGYIFPVVAGEQYFLSGKFRTSRSVTGRKCAVRMWVGYTYADVGTIFNSPASIVTDVGSADFSTTTTYIEGVYTIPAGYKFAAFGVRNDLPNDGAGGYSVIWDELMCAKRTGSTFIADGAVVTSTVAAGAIVAEKIGASAVTTDKLLANAVTADKLDVGSVTAEKVALGTLSKNLVSDPSFEDDYTIDVDFLPSTNPYRWRVVSYSLGTGSAYAAVRDTYPRSGAKCLRLSVSTADAINTSVQVMSPVYPVTPGATYVLSLNAGIRDASGTSRFYARLAGGSTTALAEYTASTDATTAAPSAAIPVANSDSVHFAENVALNYTGPTHDPGLYQNFTAEYVIPAGVNYCAVRLFNWKPNSGSSIIVDDLSFVLKGQAASELTGAGLRLFDETGVEAAALVSNRANYLTVTSGGVTRAAITSEGGMRASTLEVFGVSPLVPIIAKSLATNTATIYTGRVHGFQAGEVGGEAADTVTIANVDATFDGTYVVTDVPSPTSFSYAKTAANVAYTAVSGGTVNLGSTVADEGAALSGLTIYGDDFFQWLNNMPRGIIAWEDFGADRGPYTSETGYGEIGFDAEPGRLYRLGVRGNAEAVDATYQVKLKVRYTVALRPSDAASPTISSNTMMGITPAAQEIAGRDITWSDQKLFYNEASTTKHVRLLLTIAPYTDGNSVYMRALGGGAASLDTASDQTAGTLMFVEDVGPYRAQAGAYNLGGASSTPPPPTTYTKTWTSIGSRYWTGSGSIGYYSGSVVKQGYQSAEGDARGLWIFNNTITTALSGATITKVRIYLYANHWWYNSGGTARLKYHGFTSLPSSRPTMTTIKDSSNWPKPGGRWVDITTSGVKTALLNGNFKGIGVGSAGTTNLLYYGRFNPTGAKIEITYKR